MGVFEELKEKLFATVDYPADVSALLSNAKPWKAFCALPKELKEKFVFPNDENDTNPGYTRRQKNEGREDKEYYHFDGKHYDTHFPNAQLTTIVEEHPVLRQFFSWCADVHNAASELVVKIGEEMEHAVPGLSEQFKRSRRDFVLRLLHYQGAPELETLAAAHFDRAFTLHLFEDKEGLQYLDFDGAWKTTPITPGTTIVFSGYKFEKLTKGQCQKTWHRVLRLNGGTNNANRVSAVLFTELLGVEGYSSTQRSQDMTPGYVQK